MTSLLLHGNSPDSKVHGANMGPIWGQQDPGGPHVGPMNLVIWEVCENRMAEGLLNAHLFDSLGYRVHRYGKQSTRSNVQFIFHIIWLSLKYRGEHGLTHEHLEKHRYIFSTMATSALGLQNVTFAAYKIRNWNNFFKQIIQSFKG